MGRFEIRKAQRQKVKVKVALDGPSGSGKTLSALFIAYGLTGDWGKIVIADTENESALYYAGRTFRTKAGEVAIPAVLNHIDFKPPYHPTAWCQLIEEVAESGAEVLILDSISHEWDGEGGALDMAGGNFNNWAKVTPLHRAFIDAMRSAPIHIVATMRSKQEFSMTEKEGPGGRKKTEVVKLGMKANQRENTDYEFGVAFNIEHETHLAKTNKDRTGLFDGRSVVITPAIGQELAVWASEGIEAPVAPGRVNLNGRIAPPARDDVDGDPDAEQGQEASGERRVAQMAAMQAQLDAIAPWLEQISMIRDTGSLDELAALKEALNRAFPKKSEAQGKVLRKALEVAATVIKERTAKEPEQAQATEQTAAA